MKINSLRLFRLQAFMIAQSAQTDTGMNTAGFFQRGCRKITAWKNTRSFGRKWETALCFLFLCTDPDITESLRKFTALILPPRGKNSAMNLPWKILKPTRTRFPQKSSGIFPRGNILSAGWRQEETTFILLKVLNLK